MGLFKSREPDPNQNKGRRESDRFPLRKRMDGGLHAGLAARGQRYLNRVRTQEDTGWRY